MKIHDDCRPCLIRQMVSAAAAAGADEDKVREVETAARSMMDSVWDPGATPPAVSAPMYAMTARLCGTPDPYLAQKVRYTREALKMLPSIRERVSGASDSFEAAVRVSVAGNIIDFGTGGEGSFDLERTLNEFLVKPLLVNDIGRLREAAEKADTILFIGDNAGETVFDRPLLEALYGSELVYAAKGGAVINDATVEDAALAGVGLHARLVSTGSNAPGTILGDCSPEFLRLFEEADLVIAKGQGNFETLTEIPGRGRLFMLFTVKCPVAARQVEGEEGDMLVMRW